MASASSEPGSDWAARAAEAMAELTPRVAAAAAAVARAAARPELRMGALSADPRRALGAARAVKDEVQALLAGGACALDEFQVAWPPGAADVGRVFQAAAPLGRAAAALDAAIAAASAQAAILKPFLFAVACDAEDVGTGLAVVVARAAEVPGAPPPPPQVVAAAYGAWRVAMRINSENAAAGGRTDAAAEPLGAGERADARARARARAAEDAADFVAWAIGAAEAPALPGGEAAARRVFGAGAFQALLAPALPLLAEHAAARGEGAEGDSQAAIFAAVRAWRDCLAAATGTLGLALPEARAALEQGALELVRDAPGVAAGLFEYAAAIVRRAAALLALTSGAAPAAEPAEADATALKFALVSINLFATRLKKAPGAWAPWMAARSAAAAAPGLRALGARATPADPSRMHTAMEAVARALLRAQVAHSPFESSLDAPRGDARVHAALWLDGAQDLAAALGAGLAAALGEPRLEVLTALEAAPIVPAAWAPGDPPLATLDAAGALSVPALRAAVAWAAVAEGCTRLAPGRGAETRAALQHAAQLFSDSADFAHQELRALLFPRGAAADRAVVDAATAVAQLVVRSIDACGALEQRDSVVGHLLDGLTLLVSAVEQTGEVGRGNAGRFAVAAAGAAAVRALLRAAPELGPQNTASVLASLASACGVAAAHAADGVLALAELVPAALGGAAATQGEAHAAADLLKQLESQLRGAGGDFAFFLVASGAAAAAARLAAAECAAGGGARFPLFAAAPGGERSAGERMLEACWGLVVLNADMRSESARGVVRAALEIGAESLAPEARAGGPRAAKFNVIAAALAAKEPEMLAELEAATEYGRAAGARSLAELGGCNNPACARTAGLSRAQASALFPAQRCGRCKVVRYCGAECQRADWPAHAGVCRALLAGAGVPDAADVAELAAEWAQITAAARS